MLAFAAVSRSSSVYCRGHAHSSRLKAHFIVVRCAAGQLLPQPHACLAHCLCLQSSQRSWLVAREQKVGHQSPPCLPFASLLLQLSTCACACACVGVVVLSGVVSESWSSVCWRRGGVVLRSLYPYSFGSLRWGWKIGLVDRCVCACVKTRRHGLMIFKIRPRTILICKNILGKHALHTCTY